MGTSIFTGSADEVLLDVFEASATVDTTTTSTTDVLLNSMTLTPAAGSYLVNFSTSFRNSSNGAITRFSIYVGGVQITHSERLSTSLIAGVVIGNQPNECVVATNAICTVNGGQTIEIRWRTSAGTSTCHQRTLNALRYL